LSSGAFGNVGIVVVEIEEAEEDAPGPDKRRDQPEFPELRGAVQQYVFGRLDLFGVRRLLI
jgi:hypothetical protein